MERVFIVGPPLSGLFLIQSHLAERFDLEIVGSQDDAGGRFFKRLESEDLPAKCISACHLNFDAALAQSLVSQGFTIISVVRNPYSLLQAQFQQANSPRGIPSSSETSVLKGVALESEATIGYVRSAFMAQMADVAAWNRFPATVVLRQEDFNRDSAALFDPENGQCRGGLAQHQAVGGQLHTLADTRLSAALVGAVNDASPQDLFDCGYERLPGDAAGTLRRRSLKFSQYLQFLDDKQYLFLVGNGKSGTTWAHLALFHHPHTLSLAERRLFEHPDDNVALFDALSDDASYNSWFASSSFGKVYPDHADIRIEMKRLLSDLLAYRTFAMRLTPKGFLREEKITHITEKIALSSGADARAAMQNITEQYPDARIIHIVRDPRDVAISTLFHIYRDTLAQGKTDWVVRLVEGTPEGRPFRSRHLDRFCVNQAKAWCSVVEQFHRGAEANCSGGYRLVRYEDLLVDPERGFADMLSFAGLEASPDILQGILEQSSFEGITKGRRSGEEDKTSFFRKGVAGDWRNYLPEDRVEGLFSAARNTMEIFGYSL